MKLALYAFIHGTFTGHSRDIHETFTGP